MGFSRHNKVPCSLSLSFLQPWRIQTINYFCSPWNQAQRGGHFKDGIPPSFEAAHHWWQTEEEEEESCKEQKDLKKGHKQKEQENHPSWRRRWRVGYHYFGWRVWMALLWLLLLLLLSYSLILLSQTQTTGTLGRASIFRFILIMRSGTVKKGNQTKSSFARYVDPSLKKMLLRASALT